MVLIGKMKTHTEALILNADVVMKIQVFQKSGHSKLVEKEFSDLQKLSLQLHLQMR
jgi:hypothetical protein